MAGYASSDDGTDPLGTLSVVATPSISDSVVNSQPSGSGANTYDSRNQQNQQQALKVGFSKIIVLI